MAYSKTFLLLALVFAVVLLVSSDVSAQETVQTDAVNEAKDHGNGGHGGHDHDHGHHDHDHDHDHGHDHDHDHDHDHGHHGHHGHGAAGEKLEETDQN